MLKFGKISGKLRAIFTILILSVITITLSSCKGDTVNSIDFSKNYLSIDGYSVNNGEVWDELQWSASALFDNKAKEAIVKNQLDTVKNVINDKNHKDYANYKQRLINYLQEDVYGLSFSLESHDEEIKDLVEKDKNTKIIKYADKIYQNHKLAITRDEVISALKADDYDALSELYKIYYNSLAYELFAIEKLNEEIAEKDKEHAEDDDEDTIGYFTKSDVVSKYKSDYLNQGSVKVISIKFASEEEADQTLRAFGIKEYDGQLYYLKSGEDLSYQAFKKFYDEFDFTEKVNGTDYISLDAKYGHAAILQLYVEMYNYVYSYRSPLENIDINGTNILDQRKTTQSIINTYENLYGQDESSSEQDDLRIEAIMEAIEANEDSKEYINYTAEDAKDVDSSLYSLFYDTLKTPSEVEDNEDVNRYSIEPKSIGSSYYMAFKVSQEKTENDEIYEKDISDDDLYSKIIKQEALYEQIKQDLKDEDLTSDYISTKVNDCMKDVKVKIFDEEIQISYAKDHADYNKTLSKAPDNNTVAEFKYNDTVIYYYLTTPEGEGLWDILEYRNGTNTAVDILQTKMIKDSKEYSNIKQEDIDLYYESIEYILASFANDLLASQGYPASLGKYNFLMLYYHTADVDKIVDDILKVANAKAQILTDYASDEVADFFYNYSELAYNNFFSINATQVSVFLDVNEDGKPDDINEYKDKVVNFVVDGEEKQLTMKEVALELYKEIYNQLLSSTSDHSQALTAIIEKYNQSGRFNPNEGNQFDDENGYDPIPVEWTFSKYKKLGFAISTNDLTVTNSDTDKNILIKNKLHDVYNSENYKFKDFYPSKYLENPEDDNAIIEVDDTFNYFLITGAAKPASAKYEAYKDEDKIYENIFYRYNEKTYMIENIYNDNDLVNKNQIQAFILEYLSNETSNLIPSDIQTSITSFVNPVLTRYQSTYTQQLININYIALGDINKLAFADASNSTHYKNLLAISERTADNYMDYSEEGAEKYNNFLNWNENVRNLIGGKTNE